MKNCYIDTRENGTMRVRVVVKIGEEEIRTSTTYKPVATLTDKENVQAAELLGRQLMDTVRREHWERENNKDPMFGEFFREVYLLVAKHRIAPKSFEFNVNTNQKYFMPTFEHIRVKEITKNMLQEKIQELVNKQNENLEDPVCIQSQTVKRYVSAFRAVISLAVERGVLEQNPFEGGMHYPKMYIPQINFLDEQEYQAITKLLNQRIDNDHIKLNKVDVIIAIALLSGLRRGEIVALRWCDIENLKDGNFDACRILINNSAYKVIGEKQKIGPPKSVGSKRSFVIPRLLAKILYKWRNSNLVVSNDDFVISNGDGKMVSIYSPTRWTKKYLEKHCLPHVKLHSLRHTFASLLVRTNMDIETIREIMGHESITTTQIYVHSFKLKSKDLMADLNTYNEKFLQ